jgi:glycosyltransferase involved in cell wall biosynthesis
VKYSFIVIAYNEEANISSCIESIIAQDNLGNSYEILVIDDGSTDSTSEVIKNLQRRNKKIKLVTDGRNHGRGYSRYVGVNKSKGLSVAMVDGDVTLPDEWLNTCNKYLKEYSVVGGLIAPDGDVTYIFNKFRLTPKVVPHTTTVSGNNGLYRREVFKIVNFDPQLREGEDIDFNNRLIKHNIHAYSVKDLLVSHHENKGFLDSCLWLYQSGIGATRQLINFHKIRVPDITFICTLVLLIITLLVSLNKGTYIWLLLPLLSVVAVSFLHVQTKFVLKTMRIHSVIGAVVVTSILILCYYFGRITGPFVYIKNKVNYE